MEAAEKNTLAKTLHQIIEGAEQLIAKVQKATDDLMDWFADLADEVGRDAIERKERERQEWAENEARRSQEIKGQTNGPKRGWRR